MAFAFGAGVFLLFSGSVGCVLFSMYGGVCLKLCSISDVFFFFDLPWILLRHGVGVASSQTNHFQMVLFFHVFFRIHDVETCIPIVANFLIWHCKTGRAVKNTRFQELRWFSSFIFLPSCINSTYSTQFSGAWWRAMNMLRTQCCAKKWQQIGVEYCQIQLLESLRLHPWN